MLKYCQCLQIPRISEGRTGIGRVAVKMYIACSNSLYMLDGRLVTTGFCKFLLRVELQFRRPSLSVEGAETQTFILRRVI